MAAGPTAEPASQQRLATGLSSYAEPAAPDGGEALPVGRVQNPVPGFGSAPRPELERPGPMPEVRRLPGEERAAISALGLRCNHRLRLARLRQGSALRVIDHRGREVQQHGNGAHTREVSADFLAVEQGVLELNIHSAGAERSVDGIGESKDPIAAKVDRKSTR